jgi:2-methylaconitate cis-trans-isomerase PrpF
MYDLSKVKCCLYRGGTSRGIFFHSDDIPRDLGERKKMFLSIMGSPDIHQIDGLGGATPHTSKAVVISKSKEKGIDIEYDFYQVGIDNSYVESEMCGNLLAAAGLFAVDEALVGAMEPVTMVSVRNVKSGKLFLLHIPVKDGQSITQGTHQIDGVPRSGAKIIEEFLDPAGSTTGKLLPTGKVIDEINIRDHICRITVVDAANLTVFMTMEDANLSANERITDLSSKRDVVDHLELVRGEAARLCGVVQKADQARTKSPSLPLLMLVGIPAPYLALDGKTIQGTDYDIRSYTSHLQRFHQSIPLTGSVCIAAAAWIPGSVVNQIYKPDKNITDIRIGHPSGIIRVGVQCSKDGLKQLPYIRSVVTTRTARRLMEGNVYFPKTI